MSIYKYMVRTCYNIYITIYLLISYSIIYIFFHVRLKLLSKIVPTYYSIAETCICKGFAFVVTCFHRLLQSYYKKQSYVWLLQIKALSLSSYILCSV